MPGFESSLGRVTALDTGDDLAVQCDIERSASELYPDPFSDQPERWWHSCLLPLGPRGGQVRKRRESYTAYSIGCAVVWAAILGVLAARGEREKLRKVFAVFGGWWMGWTSATIARYVYPPAKSRPRWRHGLGT
jgi:hypothetical protein